MERIQAVLKGESADRPPVICPTSVANLDCMQIKKAYFPFVHLNEDKMAALAAAGHEELGFDSVAPYFSLHQEAAALGCHIDWGTSEQMPMVKGCLLQSPDEFKIPSDFLDQPPVRTVLRSIGILKKKYGNRVAVIGKVVGPWTLAYHLYGIQNFLLDTIIDPQKVRAILESLQEIPVKFAQAQIEAGADMITWADHATSDLVSAKGYESYLLPIHQDCAQKLKKISGGKIPVILHTCGNTLDRMDLFAKTGFDIFHFESRNDPNEAIKIMDGRMLLTGSINNPEILLKGKPENVAAQVTILLEAGIRLISPECAVPCRTKNDNLKAIVSSVISWSRTSGLVR